jgi:hypothetical protein
MEDTRKRRQRFNGPRSAECSAERHLAVRLRVHLQATPTLLVEMDPAKLK